MGDIKYNKALSSIEAGAGRQEISFSEFVHRFGPRYQRHCRDWLASLEVRKTPGWPRSWADFSPL
jgi:hypothetical protein